MIYLKNKEDLMSSVNNNGIHQEWPKTPQREQVTNQRKRVY